MKLCAIIIHWDDWDLLGHSVGSINPLVDGFVIVASEKSNFGENGDSLPFSNDYSYKSWTGNKVNIYGLEPDPKNDARTNETAKRQYGLDKARELGYTHFIMMDADEFYDPQEFLKEKQRFEDHKLLGLVCRVKCYFRSATLTIGYDTTLVPFIHKITPGLRFEFNRNYPFAWTLLDGVPFTHSKKIRIDPTRSMNINDGVKWSDITMHHFSWVRKDIRKKVRNSTARTNLERSTIVNDYVNAKPGYFCQFYQKILEECPNIFGLPEIIDYSLDDSSLQKSVPPTGTTDPG